MKKSILFFNIPILEECTKGSNEYLVVALEKFYRGIKIPQTHLEKYKPIPRLGNGFSFLCNPKPLFENKSVDVVYKAQYIRLAGRRNYFDYKFYGIKSLDLSLYPDIDLNIIKSNPLLTIANNQIYFKYEEENGS